MVPEDQLNALELVSSEMWVAREIEMLGEWHLRANDGVTYRANSVLPLGPTGLDFRESIQYCMKFYSTRKLPAMFQLTSCSVPRELDAFLEDAGWSIGLLVETKTKDLEQLPPLKDEYAVAIDATPNESWMNCFVKGAEKRSHYTQARVDLMMRAPVPKGFAQIQLDGQTVCVGLGMVHKGWLGMFRISTLPDHRRIGLASTLTNALLRWGVANGAQKAFLQVESDNDGAKRMYDQLGFGEAYSYWYRYKNEK